jgi:hypothetical protein
VASLLIEAASAAEYAWAMFEYLSRWAIMVGAAANSIILEPAS